MPDKLAAQGDEIRKRDGEIKAMPGKVHVESTPAGAAVTVDDKPQNGPTPLDVDLAPGAARPQADGPGAPPELEAGRRGLRLHADR